MEPTEPIDKQPYKMELVEPTVEPKKIARKMYCGVYHCLNSSLRNPNLSFFSLPADKERAALWLEKIKRKGAVNAKNIRVCENHFEFCDIIRHESRNRLSKDALPTLNIPEDRNRGGCYSVYTQTDSSSFIQSVDLTCSTQIDASSPANSIQTQTSVLLAMSTPQVSKLKQEIKQLKKECKQKKINEKKEEKMRQANSNAAELKTFNTLCTKYLSPKLTQLVQMQTELKNKSQGNRYSSEYKFFTLSLYYTSLQTYKLLRDTLYLPSPATMRRMYIPLSTAINDNLMNVLKTKVDRMSENQKHCTICIDAMSLKAHLYYDVKEDKIIGFHDVDGVQEPEPAKNSLVLMLRGIFDNWTQPVAFSFLAQCQNYESVKVWIDKIIMKVFEVGLKVRAFVSDMGYFVQAAEQRGVSPTNPFFFVNNHKIYYVFDAPHLIKIIRNTFLTNNFCFNGGFVAKWEHIVKCYEYDCQRSLKLNPKLTNAHVKPTNLEKMKVKLATQVLSMSTATLISTCIDLKVVDPLAFHTVQFILKMNDLFDILNSSNSKTKCYYKKGFIGEQAQNDFLVEMYYFFENLQIIHTNGALMTKQAKFIDGIKITIRSVMLLYEDLKAENHNVLLTRRLNQDCLKSFFEKVREQSGNTPEPTCRQIVFALRKFFLINVLELPVKEKSNDDLDNVLSLFQLAKDLTPFLTVEMSGTETSTAGTVVVKKDHYKDVDIPETNALFFVARYLLKKCMEIKTKHNKCEKLLSYANSNMSMEFAMGGMDPSVPQQAGEILPPPDFLRFVENLEMQFRTYFESGGTNHGKVLTGLLKIFENVNFVLPCECFPMQYCKKLYGLLRIYYILKYNNNSFKKGRQCRKYFVVNSL